MNFYSRYNEAKEKLIDRFAYLLGATSTLVLGASVILGNYSGCSIYQTPGIREIENPWENKKEFNQEEIHRKIPERERKKEMDLLDFTRPWPPGSRINECLA